MRVWMPSVQFSNVTSPFKIWLPADAIATGDNTCHTMCVHMYMRARVWMRVDACVRVVCTVPR